MYPSDWSAPSTPLHVLGSYPYEDSTSSFLPESSVTPLLPTIPDLAVKLWLPFTFLDTKKVPDVWGWVTFNPLIEVAFGSRRSLTSAHFSDFQAAKSRAECLAGCSPPLYGLTFISIQGSGPHRSSPSLFSPCAPVGSFPDTPIGVSGPAATIASQIWPCFFLILVSGSKDPCSRHQTSLPCHNAHPKSGRHQPDSILS